MRFLYRSLLVLFFFGVLAPAARADWPDWINGGRFCGHWIWAAEYDAHLYTDEQLMKEVADAAGAGYNVICTGLPLGGRGILGIDDPEIVHQLKVVVDEAHRRGMRVMFHYVTLNVKEIKERYDYQGMSQIDAETGKPVEVLATWKGPHEHYFWALCPNNPAVRKAHLETMANFFRDTGMDGFFTDLVWRAPYACVCPSCRAKFKADTGIALPETFDKSFYGNIANKDYHTWTTWRARQLAQFLRDVRGALKKVHSDIAVGAYEAGAPGTWRNGVPLSIEDCAGIDDIAVETPRSFTHYYNWPEVTTTVKYCAGVAEACGLFPWWSAKPASLSEGFFCWSMGWATRVRDWNFVQGTPATMKLQLVKREYWDWEPAHMDWLKNAAPYRDAALYFSLTSRDFYAWKNTHVREYTGWSEALLRANQPFDAIIDGFAGNLSPFRVVILPNVAAIPPDMAKRLEKYVADGGTVIATCETGSASGGAGLLPDCAKRPAAEVKDKTLVIADKTLADLVGAAQVPYSGDVKDCSGADAALLTLGGKPCAAVRKIGKGRVIYLGFYPGFAAVVRYMEREKAYSLTETDLANAAAMTKLLKALAGEYAAPARMRLTNLPDGVIVMTDFHADGPRRWLNVHVINATRSEPKPGMLVPMSYEIPTDKVVLSGTSIRLALPQGSTAAEVRLLTPDTDAATEFDWSAVDGAVVIKPRDLVRYSIFSVVLK